MISRKYRKGMILDTGAFIKDIVQLNNSEVEMTILEPGCKESKQIVPIELTDDQTIKENILGGVLENINKLIEAKQ